MKQRMYSPADYGVRCTAIDMPEKAPEAYPMRYVEGLNDARTTLADFFSILLVGASVKR